MFQQCPAIMPQDKAEPPWTGNKFVIGAVVVGTCTMPGGSSQLHASITYTLDVTSKEKRPRNYENETTSQMTRNLSVQDLPVHEVNVTFSAQHVVDAVQNKRTTQTIGEDAHKQHCRTAMQS